MDKQEGSDLVLETTMGLTDQEEIPAVTRPRQTEILFPMILIKALHIPKTSVPKLLL